MSLVAFAGLMGLSVLVGWGLRPWWHDERDPPETAWVFAVVTGWVGIDALLLWLSLAGIRWSVWAILPALLGLALWNGWRRRASRPAASAPRPAFAWGWGDGLAAAALATLAVLAARGALLFPDFVYHWGTKAQKFALARGVDFAYLAKPWLADLHHPEYPHLLPNLGALTTIAGGGFDARAAGLWSIAALVVTAVAVRAALGAGGASRFVVQSGAAWAGCALAAFGIGQLLAGSADPFLALALAAALPALLRADATSPARDLQIGFAAALAASAKLEGVVLAAILLGAALLGRRATVVASALRMGAPVALVAAPWLYGCWRHDLRSTAAGALDWSRLATVAEGLARQLVGPAWAGMAILLLLLPVLLWRRKLRAVGVVIALQLGFYAVAYLSAPFEPGYYIVATFPRLLLHVVPALMVGLLSALDGVAAGTDVQA